MFDRFPSTIRVVVEGTITVNHVHSGSVSVIVEQALTPAVGGRLTHSPVIKQP